MKIILFLSVLLISSFGFGQEFNILWQRNYGGSEDDVANSIQQTSDGGYIIAGYSRSDDGEVTDHIGSTNYSDYWILKTDDTGSIIWRISLGGSNDDYARSIQQTTDGGYIVGGTSISSDGQVSGNNGFRDYWIVKLDSSGNIIWEKTLGGSGNEYAKSIKQTSDGGYVIAGYSIFSNDGDVTGNHGDEDYWIVKLDANGNIIWQKSLGGSNEDRAESIQQTTDDGYIVAGSSLSNDGDVTGNHGNLDYWVVKLDVNGNILWQKSLGGSLVDNAYSIKQTSDGGYIVAGDTGSDDGDVSSNNGGDDFWIVKLNNFGDITWQKSLGGTFGERSYSIVEKQNGGFLIAGSSNSSNGDITSNNGSVDFWIVALDNTGSIVEQKSLGGLEWDAALSIQQTSDGGSIIAGYTNSSDGDVIGNYGGSDFWIIKFGNCSNIVIDTDPADQNVLVNNTANFTITTNVNSPSFQWQINNGTNWSNLANTGQISGVNTNTLTISNTTLSQNNSQYRCIITKFSNCSDTSEFAVLNVEDDASITKFPEQIINLFPNPTSNTFTITTDQVINASFKIVDTQGKKVLSGKMSGKEQTIDISSLSKGTYSIVFEDEKLPVLSVIKE